MSVEKLIEVKVNREKSIKKKSPVANAKDKRPVETSWPGIGTVIAVEYPEIDRNVGYEFGEYCGRVIRKSEDRIQVFFPFEDCEPIAVWLKERRPGSGETWIDCSTPALVNVRPASAAQTDYTISRLSEERWNRLMSFETKSENVEDTKMSITPQQRAKNALDALERSVIDVLANHPEGLSNAAIERELDIGSDRRGQQKGWLCWSILSRLLSRNQIIKEGQQYRLPPTS